MADTLRLHVSPACFSRLRTALQRFRRGELPPPALAAAVTALLPDDDASFAALEQLLSAMPPGAASPESAVAAVREARARARRADNRAPAPSVEEACERLPSGADAARWREEVERQRQEKVPTAAAARAAAAQHIGDAKATVAKANKRRDKSAGPQPGKASPYAGGAAPPKPSEIPSKFVPTSVLGAQSNAQQHSTAPIVVWFRMGDLRLDDNPMLHHACFAAGARRTTTTAEDGRPGLAQALSKSAKRRLKAKANRPATPLDEAPIARAVVPVFVLGLDEEEGGWPMGGATRYYLHHSLLSLAKSLEARFGWRLVCRRADGVGGTAAALEALIDEVGAGAVYYSRAYEPWHLIADDRIHQRLVARNLDVRAFNSRLLYEPWDADPDATDEACWNSGYGSVRFFLNGCHQHKGPHPDKPLPIPPRPPPPSVPAPAVESCGVLGLGLVSLPRIPVDASPNDAGAFPLNPKARRKRAPSMKTHDWGSPFFSDDAWRAGEGAAQAALSQFVLGEVADATQELLEELGESPALPKPGVGAPNSALASFDAKRVQVESGFEAAAPASCERHRADGRNTSRLSPHLRIGELSARRVYWAAREALEASIEAHSMTKRHAKVLERSVATFLRRLAWRDLAYWALWRFPHMTLYGIRPWYDLQAWSGLWWFAEGDVKLSVAGGDPAQGLPATDVTVTVAAGAPSTTRPYDAVRLSRKRNLFQAEANPLLRAWQSGTTGYPLVDAAMVELWRTGYMNNYTRHVCAGFLVEYLGIDWRFGALWFHDTLVDADVAINSAMWQNGGHSGMDQWNFVMHPVYAAKACDPDGNYVRRWLPQLAKLPLEFVHCPWEAPHHVRAKCRVRLGGNYPERVVSNLDARLDQSVRAVVALRKQDDRRGDFPYGLYFALPDGNDALPLPDSHGKVARAITRVDYKVMSDVAITKQTAAKSWDARRRDTPGDAFAV